MAARPGNIYHNIQISGNAQVLLGDTVSHTTGQSNPAAFPSSFINSPQSPPSPPVPTIRGSMPTRRSDQSPPTSRVRGYIRRSKSSCITRSIMKSATHIYWCRRPKQHIRQYRESVLGMGEAKSEAIANYDPVAARLPILLAFIYFEDFSINLFGEDQSNLIPSGHAGTTRESEVAISTYQIMCVSSFHLVLRYIHQVLNLRQTGCRGTFIALKSEPSQEASTGHLHLSLPRRLWNSLMIYVGVSANLLGLEMAKCHINMMDRQREVH